MQNKFLSTLVVLFLAPVFSPSLGAQEETIVFLVRHAERADDSNANSGMMMDPGTAEDPPLSEAGRVRAALLAEMIRDVGITHIHSTDRRRTRETAQPTAEATGLEIEIYDGSDLEVFADHLRSTPGRHLVVGHSNTNPGLVKALGGDPGLPIELMEYDRLYVVTLGPGGVQTVLLRFGELFEG